MQERKGFDSVCVTDTGKVGGKLLGLVTSRDYDFVTKTLTPLADIMTTDLETADAGRLPATSACAGLAFSHNSTASQRGVFGETFR
mgnify:CR=1 FL=1